MAKTILFTGGSGKLGATYLKYASEKKIKVLTTVRNKIKFLQEHPFIGACEHISIVEVDFTESDAINKILAFVKCNCIEIDTIVHNARCVDYLKIEPDGTTSAPNFLGELFLDVVFPYRLTVELLLAGIFFSNVVIISSMYGVVAPNPSLYDDFDQSSSINYGVAKAAQIHLTKELAVRLSSRNIRVNSISYGGIEGRVNSQFVNRYKKLSPLNKMLSAEDTIAPLTFLISDASKDMTGHNLVVDGGWSIW